MLKSLRVHYNSIVMDKIIIPVILFSIYHLEKVVDNMHQEIYMKECGSMENDMVMEFFHGVMEMVNIWDNGLMVYKYVLFVCNI
jgi:hypothetical protein